MITCVFFLAFCALVSAIAKNRGRNWIVWFLVSMLISPLLAGIILAILELSKKV